MPYLQDIENSFGYKLLGTTVPFLVIRSLFLLPSKFPHNPEHKKDITFFYKIDFKFSL